MTFGEWISNTLAKIGSKIKLPKNVLNNLKVNLLNNINNNSPVIYDKRTQILNIDLGKQSPEVIKNILSSLPEMVDAGFPTLKLTSTQKAEDYLEKIGVSENQKLIDYYADKLPVGDLVILKASLYLKSVLNKGGETISIKNDIAKRFGARGRNISNLCSANYFNTVIKTVYESMAEAEDFKKEMFWKEYNFIVDIYPFAVFVNIGMGEKEIKKTILEKIKWNKKYDHHELNIHGIGKININKITNVLKEIEKEFDIKDKTVNLERGIIVIKLVF